MQQIYRKFSTLFRRIKVMRNWYSFCWPMTRLGSWPKTAELRTGAKIVIRGFRTSDFAIFNEVVIDDVYLVDSYVAPKRIIDLGANIGVFTILVAKKFPEATVIALEPERENFAILKRNVEESGAKNVVLVNKAISSSAGTASLQVSGNNTGAHSIFNKISDAKAEVQVVPTVPLRDFLPLDIMKVDIEGAEYEIFKNEIPDCKMIVMETHGGNDEGLFDKLSTKYQKFTHSTSYGLIHVFKHK